MFANIPTMTREDQIKFVKDLTNSITNSMLAHIEAGIVPSRWGGVELRMYITDCMRVGCNADRFATLTHISEYKNDIMVRDL